jgi:hypothetical protein
MTTAAVFKFGNLEPGLGASRGFFYRERRGAGIPRGKYARRGNLAKGGNAAPAKPGAPGIDGGVPVQRTGPSRGAGGGYGRADVADMAESLKKFPRYKVG